MSAVKKNITQTLKTLPESPGVYQFFDKKNNVLYVGKAKRLKRRVVSYFKKNYSESAKTKVLVSKIERIECIVVKNEVDALLLENNLIKDNLKKGDDIIVMVMVKILTKFGG